MNLIGELGQLHLKADSLKEAGISIVAVSADSSEDAAKAKQKSGADFRFLSDTSGALMDVFGLRHVGGHPFDDSDIARPASLLVSQRGELLWAKYADNYRVRPTADEVVDEATQAMRQSATSSSQPPPQLDP